MDTAQAQQQIAHRERRTTFISAARVEQRVSSAKLADKMAYAQWEKSLGGTPTAAKPNITLKQAQDAYQSGIRTSAVQNALSYYLGDDFFDGGQAKPQGTQTNWSNLEAYVDYLESIGYTPQQAAQAVKNNLGR